MLLYHNVVYLHYDNKTTDNNKQKHTIMKSYTYQVAIISQCSIFAL
nr:MAG TPA: hypothetical protein [Caudoviricetes sp.]